MQIMLEVPEQFALDVSPVELGQRTKLYVALTLYQSGSIAGLVKVKPLNRSCFLMISEI